MSPSATNERRRGDEYPFPDEPATPVWEGVPVPVDSPLSVVGEGRAEGNAESPRQALDGVEMAEGGASASTPAAGTQKHTYTH